MSLDPAKNRFAQSYADLHYMVSLRTEHEIANTVMRLVFSVFRAMAQEVAEVQQSQLAPSMRGKSSGE